MAPKPDSDAVTIEPTPGAYHPVALRLDTEYGDAPAIDDPGTDDYAGDDTTFVDDEPDDEDRAVLVGGAAAGLGAVIAIFMAAHALAIPLWAVGLGTAGVAGAGLGVRKAVKDGHLPSWARPTSSGPGSGLGSVLGGGPGRGGRGRRSGPGRRSGGRMRPKLPKALRNLGKGAGGLGGRSTPSTTTGGSTGGRGASRAKGLGKGLAKKLGLGGASSRRTATGGASAGGLGGKKASTKAARGGKGPGGGALSLGGAGKLARKAVAGSVRAARKASQNRRDRQEEAAENPTTRSGYRAARRAQRKQAKVNSRQRHWQERLDADAAADAAKDKRKAKARRHRLRTRRRWRATAWRWAKRRTLAGTVGAGAFILAATTVVSLPWWAFGLGAVAAAGVGIGLRRRAWKLTTTAGRRLWRTTRRWWRRTAMRRLAALRAWRPQWWRTARRHLRRLGPGLALWNWIGTFLTWVAAQVWAPDNGAADPDAATGSAPGDVHDDEVDTDYKPPYQPPEKGSPVPFNRSKDRPGPFNVTTEVPAHEAVKWICDEFKQAGNYRQPHERVQTDIAWYVDTLQQVDVLIGDVFRHLGAYYTEEGVRIGPWMQAVADGCETVGARAAQDVATTEEDLDDDLRRARNPTRFDLKSNV